MKYSDARSALYTRLNLFPGLPATMDWENVRFDKPGLAPYLMESLKPVSAKRQSLGPKGRVRDFGLWLLGVFTPADEGPKVGDDLADGLREWFYPGLALTTPAGLSVIIREATRSPTIQEDDWRHVPVSILWFVDSFNAQ